MTTTLQEFTAAERRKLDEFARVEPLAESAVERVARALWASDWCSDASTVTWESEVEENRKDYRVLAAAAVQAMKPEPQP